MLFQTEYKVMCYFCQSLCPMIDYVGHVVYKNSFGLTLGTQVLLEDWKCVSR